MIVEIKVPSVGESVKEAYLVQWYKQEGDRVHKDDPLLVIETDKVTLEIPASVDGVLKIEIPEDETVAIGTVVGTIATEEIPGAAESPAPQKEAEEPPPPPVDQAEPPREPVPPGEPILPPSVRRLVAERNIEVAISS